MNDRNVSGPLCQACWSAFRAGPPNQPISCGSCGKIFWKNHAGIVYVFYAPGKISEDWTPSIFHPRFKIRPLVWQKDRHGSVYFPCGECGRVLKVDGIDISAENVIRDKTGVHQPYVCIKCVHCACHLWPYFEGFTAPKEGMIESRRTVELQARQA